MLVELAFAYEWRGAGDRGFGRWMQRVCLKCLCNAKGYTASRPRRTTSQAQNWIEYVLERRSLQQCCWRVGVGCSFWDMTPCYWAVVFRLFYPVVSSARVTGSRRSRKKKKRFCLFKGRNTHKDFFFFWIFRPLRMRLLVCLKTSGDSYPVLRLASFSRRTNTSTKPLREPKNSQDWSLLGC
jgi:hypothetical protein